MQHSVEQMYLKAQALLLLAEEAKKAKYDDADSQTGDYDIDRVTHLVEQVQALAGDIYNDKTIHPKLKEKHLNMMWKELHQDA